MNRPVLFSLLFAALALAPGLGAQPVREAPARAPAPEIVPEELIAPPLPIRPRELDARVAALTRIAEQTSECYTEEGERSEHFASPSCGRWYAALVRGGTAAAFAIGGVLILPAIDGTQDYRVRTSEGEIERGPRLVQVLAATGAPEAASFMLRYLTDTMRNSPEDFSVVDAEILRQLPRLAGYDVAPVGSWEAAGETTNETRREVASRWIRWLNEHQGQTRAEWLAEGESRSLNDLRHEDAATRYAAMRRLASRPVHRAAVAAALRDLLTRANLPASARVELRRWAVRARIVLPATARA